MKKRAGDILKKILCELGLYKTSFYRSEPSLVGANPIQPTIILIFPLALAFYLLTFPLLHSEGFEARKGGLARRSPPLKQWRDEGGDFQINVLKIIQIESSGNPLAFNRNSGARGLMQITPLCLKEWNNFHSTEQYTLRDLFNPEINIKVGTWYLNQRIPQLLRHYKLAVDTDNMLWAYNAGILRVINNEMPKETRDYLRRYRR